MAAATCFPASFRVVPRIQLTCRDGSASGSSLSGLSVTTHQFRHIAAKFWLDENPGSYEVVRRILHHRSIDTTTASYTGFETRAAALHYDQFILKQRSRYLEFRGSGNG